MTDTRIRLVVIIPVYENWGDTLDCLRHLAKQTEPDFHVLLADDGSPQPPPAAVMHFTFVHYVRRENAGFAGNCNRAAKQAIALGATHLLLLNNDTEFGPDFIRGWLREIAARPSAILSPLVYWASQPDTVWYSGGRKSILIPFFRLCRDYSEPTIVDIVSGCALLTPVSVWQQLDGLDERYSFYFEDLDFSLRARRRGIPCVVLPASDVRVWHKVHGSFRGTGAWKRQYRLIGSQLYFVRSHYEGLSRLLALLLCFVHVAVFWLLNLPQMPDRRQLRDAIDRGIRGVASVRA